MYSLFSAVARCPRRALARLYSSDTASDVAAMSRQKWRMGLTPAPRSLLDDDDTPVDLSEDNEVVNGVRPDTPPIHRRAPPARPTPSEYAAHRRVMKAAFPEGWRPPRTISREAMEGIRQLYRYDNTVFTTPVLAEKFKISPEAVRRILKSKWEPSKEQKARFAERDRLRREAKTKLSLMKERIETEQVMRLRKGEFARRRRSFRSYEQSRGIDEADRLTFE